MNAVFFGIIALAFGVAGIRQILEPGAAPMDALGNAAMKSAEGAVSLAIGLIGSMALFLGLMKVAEALGLLQALARLLRPLLHRLFPEVPPEHPAMGAMVMNVSANMLGLSNAATPFGVKAMEELDRLNPVKGLASDAMVLFLALNTANVTLLPTHVLALRTAAGSHDPGAVVPTTLFATFFSTLIAIAFARWGRAWFPVEAKSRPREEAGPDPAPPVAFSTRQRLGLAGVVLLMACLLVWGRAVSPWIVPALFVAILGAGMVRRVPVYEVFVSGAKEGLSVSLRILPYLIAVLAAVGMFRESGAMDMLMGPLGRLTTPLGVPVEALTMAVLRSLSGSASFGYLASLLNDPAIGPDSYTGLLVSTIYGSSETTFYVLAVYFGAAGVKRIRHALIAGLLADLGGLVFSTIICGWIYR